MKTTTRWIPGCLALFAFACGGGSDDGSLYTDDGALTLGDGIDSANTMDSTSTMDSGGTKLDSMVETTGMATAGDGGEAKGCKAIDFLFVIDNSGSMGDNQQNLIGSFPGFIQKIQETIAEVDSYHIMVVDTDEYWNDCTIECAFPFPVCTFGGVDGCDGAPTVCDETLGAGVNFPLGDDASNKYCGLTGGQRYI
ncbi:MAG: hypothetical protein KC457_10525, partial [Myxococcales bacterium]|nr:hypothetical protein [Myxococcales bacterium]